MNLVGMPNDVVENSFSLAASQWITFLYSLGVALKPKWFVGFLGNVLIATAASGVKALSGKVVLSVPAALVDDQAAIDGIQQIAK